MFSVKSSKYIPCDYFFQNFLQKISIFEIFLRKIKIVYSDTNSNLNLSENFYKKIFYIYKINKKKNVFNTFTTLFSIYFSMLFLLLSNAVTLRRDKSILFSRVAIIVLLYSSLIAVTSLYFTYLDRGIGLYGGLFHATSMTQIFHIFIFFISAIILQLTGFYPRKV